MKRRTKMITAFLLGAVLVLASGCGKVETALDDSAASRDESELDSTEVYLDDGAIALAADAGTATEYVDAAAAAFEQVNMLRAAAGLGTLEWNSDLESAARVRAAEATGYFSHTRPDGTAWWTVDSRVMYGENLAKGFYTADSVVNAWVASPTHYENLMKPGFKTMAIVIVPADNGTWFWAQEFGY